MKKLIIYAIALTTMLSMLAALGSCGEKEPLPVSVTNVELNVSSLDLTEGDEVTLTATIAPENAANKAVSWNSSDNTVATVSNGKVMAVKAGNATITVTTEDGGKSATCEITVMAKVYSVESVSLDKTSVELTEGDEVTLIATVTPDNATNKTVLWNSSDESVASVADGVVTAHKEGTVTITVTTEDGNKTATCDVTVLHDPSNDAIVFADEVMKGMCVTAFDTNGDGELSYAEAAAVTNLSNMQLTDKSFTSFDEFQYFTSVKSIPEGYFQGSELNSIVLPENLENIGKKAFIYCANLTSITIPDSVTNIEKWAFGYCTSLTSIALPESLTSIEYAAFAYCSNLVSITLPDSVSNIGEWVFGYCVNLTSITIPDSVTSIEGMTFAYCSSLTSITIPESVTRIGDSAFRECSSLQSINIPESVISIGEYAFYGCISLASIIIPNSVTNVGGSAFYECTSLTSVTLSESMTTIEYSLFDRCSSLTSVIIPESVTSIGNMAFYDCTSLTSITIPESVTSIGGHTFAGCDSLTSITIPDSVTSIGGYAFYDCHNLASVTLPKSLPSIEPGTFIRCYGFKSIIIPESVTSIGYYAFLSCIGLTSITIPESVTIIGYSAFDNCYNLKTVYVQSLTPCKLEADVFASTKVEVIYVPKGSEETYKTAEGWCEYADLIQGYNL